MNTHSDAPRLPDPEESLPEDGVPEGRAPEGGSRDDDEIIGRVFRYSLVAILIGVALAIAVTVVLLRREPTQGVVEQKDYVPPKASIDRVEFPKVPWIDVTREAGIDFVHRNGARGDKLLPETMVGGCAFFDHDNDGDADLLLIGGTHWNSTAAEAETARSGEPSSLCLYENDGAGGFNDVTARVGLTAHLYGMGVAIGDYDGDGDLDVYVTAVGENRLYRRDGDRYTDVTRAAGVAGSPGSWSTSAAFFDGDQDGDLDLFVCNYVRWSREIDLEVDFRLDGVGRAYGPPTLFQGADPYYFRNDGEGKFVDATEPAGFSIRHPNTGAPVAKALACLPFDFDRDGHIDLFVANDTVQNFVFRGLGDGRFEEVGAYSGLGFDRVGSATGAMGADVAHLWGNEAVAVAVANFANEMTSLYLSSGEDWLFSDESASQGIGPDSLLRLSFGLFFFDYDLDGRLDLFQSNGHLEESIGRVQPSQTYRQAAQLFWNRGPEARRQFGCVPERALGALAQPIVGRGASMADIDLDGDLDVLLTETGGRSRLIRNDQGLGHHWVQIKLRGRGPNRDAIGARIELTSGGAKQIQYVSPAFSYLSQRETIVTFGLGTVSKVESVRVTWPDGTQQDVTDVPLDKRVEITQE